MAQSENILGAQDVPLFYKVADPARRRHRGAGAPARPGRAARRALADGDAEGGAGHQLATGDVWRLTSDEGAYLDGHDEAPCPLSFLSTGMVSSYMNELTALAEARGLDLGRIRIVQDNFYTMKGSALQGTMTGGAKDIELDVSVEADIAPESACAPSSTTPSPPRRSTG